MDILNNKQVENIDNFECIRKSMLFIQDNLHSQPSLDEIAESVNLSKYHFQRLFTSWAGISPSKFLQYLTINNAKSRLKTSRSLMNISSDIGLSSTSRLNDLFVTFDSMTPDEYRKDGDSLNITYGFGHCHFGECFIAWTDRGICKLSFLQTHISEDDTNLNNPSKDNYIRKENYINELRSNWPLSKLQHDDISADSMLKEIFSIPDKNSKLCSNKDRPKILLKGTNFQIKVWEALLEIPYGSVLSYKDIAIMIGKPTASRAVGSAVGKNSIAYLVPCHRVIREMGSLNNYRWGSEMKKLLLGWECSNT